MAIGIIFEGPGVTQAQYDHVRDRVTPGNQVVTGLLYHVAGPTENGFCVVEIWESQEVAQQFFEAKLKQALQEAQITVQPKFFQVVNIMKP